MSSDIMFQCFRKDLKIDNQSGQLYNFLIDRVYDIAEAGFSLIWFPPPSKSKHQNYVGYTPMDYYDLGEFKQWAMGYDKQWFLHHGEKTLHGGRSELEKLINMFRERGIKCIADIVINHREAQQVNSEGEWCSWAGPEHTIASKKMAWGYSGIDNDPEQIVRASGGGIFEDSGDGGFECNIAHNNPNARDDIKEWMKWLKNDIGFEGWRYDYAKGYDAKYIGEYNESTGNMFSVGEYWDYDTQKIYDWIDNTDPDSDKRSKAFDFPLREHLKNIFSGFRCFSKLVDWEKYYVSIMGGWPEKAVTFIENHDTEDNAYFPEDKKKIVQGYAFLLTHPGIPCVYWSHFYGKDGRNQDSYIHDSLKKLGNFRKNNGITSTSDIKIVRTDKCCYVAEINGNILIKIGNGKWSPGNMWDEKLSGDGWVVWKK